ncbi:MAG: trypsin-like serine protease [Planctomycetaceae bacterium]
MGCLVAIGVMADRSAANSDPASAPNTGESTRADLMRQETRVVHAKSSGASQLSAAELANRAKAAAAFAKELAGDDDQRFVSLFRDAFNLAVGTSGSREMLPGTNIPKPVADPRFSAFATSPASAAALSPDSIYTDPEYIKNSKKYLESLPARVVGGVPTSEYADCVAVGTSAGWCCTGTLVAPNVVISAGHCYGGCASRVFVGSDVTLSGSVFKVKSAVRHPDYGKAGLHNDLMVLILEQDVPGVKPRPFAPSSAIDAGFFVRAVGFGNTDVHSSIGFGIKRVVDIPMATPNCETSAAQSRYGCDNGLELVAGAPFLDKDTCNGDSGGPVYVEHNGNWYLAGATSRATRDSIRPCGDGGIYVRLDKYIDWIKSVPGGKW